MVRSRQNKKRIGSYLHDSLFYDERVGRLSRTAYQLLTELNQQFNGYNNGNLCATHKCLRFDWNDKTLKKARRELVSEGLIEVTRLGRKRRPTLYALCHLPINENVKNGIRATDNCTTRATGKREHYFPVRRNLQAEVKQALKDSADKKRLNAEMMERNRQKWSGSAQNEE